MTVGALFVYSKEKGLSAMKISNINKFFEHQCSQLDLDRSSKSFDGQSKLIAYMRLGLLAVDLGESSFVQKISISALQLMNANISNISNICFSELDLFQSFFSKILLKLFPADFLSMYISLPSGVKSFLIGHTSFPSLNQQSETKPIETEDQPPKFDISKPYSMLPFIEDLQYSQQLLNFLNIEISESSNIKIPSELMNSLAFEENLGILDSHYFGNSSPCLYELICKIFFYISL
ncbi:hypothetical protein GEMRC1_004484 [Eukaryota sp. GEM-RC1]